MQRAQSAEYTGELLTMPGWSTLSIFCCQWAPISGWHTQHRQPLPQLTLCPPIPISQLGLKIEGFSQIITLEWSCKLTTCLFISVPASLSSHYKATEDVTTPNRAFSALLCFGSPRKQSIASVHHSFCHLLSGGGKAQ